MTVAQGATLCAISLGFGVAIAESEDPVLVAVGLSPLIWIALEMVHRLLEPPPGHSPQETGAASRTGSRRNRKRLRLFS